MYYVKPKLTKFDVACMIICGAIYIISFFNIIFLPISGIVCLCWFGLKSLLG